MRIAVIGAGKMGSWLAKELSGENELAVYDVDSARAMAVEGAKALSSLEKLADFKPEMLLNAVSLQRTLEAFEAAAKHLPDGCMLADVASIKSGIPDYYKACGRRFVSVHPMFGPTFANVESLDKENAVIITESDPEGKELFRALFKRLRVRIFEYSFDGHDRMMAYSLTTPFAASLVFAACMESASVPGATFARHKKIAKGLLSEDDHLLSEILFNKYSLPQVERITGRLEYLKHIIKGRDHEEAKKFFDKLRKNIGD
ncbi:MAG: prephenate dehydrogenase/arogenate dehydrogenase family protein [Candidatus Micrarchaeota archaeon]